MIDAVKNKVSEKKRQIAIEACKQDAHDGMSVWKLKEKHGVDVYRAAVDEYGPLVDE